MDNATVGIIVLLPLLVIGFALGLLFQGAIVVVVSQDASSGEPGLAFALRSSASKLRDMFWASLRAVAISTGFAITLVGLPWAVRRAVRWYFVVQGVMLDGQDKKTALDFSAALVVAAGWRRIARRILAVAAITGTPTLLMLVAILTVAQDFIASSLLQVLVSSLTTPVYAAAITLMYLDLKVAHTAGSLK